MPLQGPAKAPPMSRRSASAWRRIIGHKRHCGNGEACVALPDRGELRPVLSLRAMFFTLLPKVLLSRTTGMLVSLPLPTPLRAPFYRWFARRYGAELADLNDPLSSFRSLQAFFQRALNSGARPIATTPLVWPCDGRIVTSGPIGGDRIPQIKGNDYSVADLVGDADLAKALAGGSQATIYLAPGDYHRVHIPFAANIEHVRAIRGTLFPVNPKAVACIDRLFVRNSRHVFRCRLADGRLAVVAMVGAFNVGDTRVTVQPGQTLIAGGELGRFGFGSTAVVILGKGITEFPAVASQTRVQMGGAVPN